MIIDKTVNANIVTLKVQGRLDTTTAPELEAAIDTSLAVAQELVLDFTDLEYISSAGLRVLLKAQKSMQKHGGMKICNANESIMEVFEITGFADILIIE